MGALKSIMSVLFPR